jgi:hypothetical protein
MAFRVTRSITIDRPLAATGSGLGHVQSANGVGPAVSRAQPRDWNLHPTGVERADAKNIRIPIEGATHRLTAGRSA